MSSALDQILLIPGIGRKTEIVLPSAFNDFGIDVSVFRNGTRSYSIDKTVEGFMPTTTAIYYVDGTNGDNANDGLTPATPKLTIGGATSVGGSTARRVLIAPGQYTFAHPGKDVIYEGWGGTWALSGNISLSHGSIDAILGFRDLVVNYGITVSNRCTAVFDAPHCEVASGARAIQGSGTGRVITFGATAVNCERDVLSYTSDSHALEVDCNIDDNGTQDGDNCSTGHMNSKIICIGGTYRNSYRNIADIGNSKRAMFGSVVNTSKNPSGSTSSNIRSGSTAANTTEIWCYGVDARGGATNELMTENGGKLYYDNETLFDTTSGSDITLFDRQSRYS